MNLFGLPDPMDWPVDVFDQALADIRLFQAESQPGYEKLSMRLAFRRRSERERKRQVAARAGLPPLFVGLKNTSDP